GLTLLRIAWGFGQASIGVDNVAAIRATRDMTPKSGGYLLDGLHREAEDWTEERDGDMQLLVRWVPGHLGIKGNEVVDGEAKRAAAGDEDFGSMGQDGLPAVIRGKLPIGRSAVKQAYLGTLKKRARNLFEDRDPRTGRVATRCTNLRRIDPTSPSPRFQKAIAGAQLPRRQASLLIQLRTGHVPLRRHLFTIGKVDSPTCPACGEHPESVFHFLMACP
ncbi:hypothetical protein BV25DRAFT_1764572, partial [Artomyces pyxidatus]